MADIDTFDYAETDFLARRLRGGRTTNPAYSNPGDYLVVLRFPKRVIPATKNSSGTWRRLDATGMPRRLHSKPQFVVAALDIYESDQ